MSDTTPPGPDYLTRLAPLRPVEPLPVVPLDPDKVRAQLDELERERDRQQYVVTWLDDALDGAERTLTSIDRRLSDLRAHPAVRAALQLDQAP
jgi:hypothetical protein